MFDAKKVKDECVEWIRDFFEKNGKGCNAVIGISGGKDRVIGVLMPCGEQHDIDCARQLVEHLGIKNFTINILDAVNGVKEQISSQMELSNQAIVNIPPRVRMTTLYAVSQCMNGRVVNTCNLSEDWVGYSTRYGDAAGDFSPLSNLTVQEIKAIGHLLDLPKELVEKIPIDGLCGKTDEDNLGFTYAVLDRYIREGEIDDPEIKKLIDEKHEKNLFKLQLMPAFVPKN